MKNQKETPAVKEAREIVARTFVTHEEFEAKLQDAENYDPIGRPGAEVARNVVSGWLREIATKREKIHACINSANLSESRNWHSWKNSWESFTHWNRIIVDTPQERMAKTALNNLRSATGGCTKVARLQDVAIGSCAAIGSISIVPRESVEENWNYYSKAYHSRFGPKRTTENRCVEFWRDGVKFAQHDLSTWRGQWLLDAVRNVLGEKHIVEKSLRKVQLHTALRVKLEREIGNVKIYRRLLCGEVYDYCAIRGQDTFHAATAKAAVAGLREKIQARADKDAEILRANFVNGKCIVAGARFCSTGVRSFCADNGIDEGAEMTRAELRAIVLRNRTTNCEKYAQELRTIGISVNCK